MAKRNTDSAEDSTLYVRVTSEIKDALVAIGDREDKSQAFIVSRILADFLRYPETEQHDIIHGTGSGTTIAETSDLLMRLTWADHAFTAQLWTWACEKYMWLAEKSSERAPSVWAFAQYRLGYCWNKIAGDLSQEAVELRDHHLRTQARDRITSQFGVALESSEQTIHLVMNSPLSQDTVELAGNDLKRFHELFDAADWAVRASIVFHERFLAREERIKQHDVLDLVTYNNSCNWMLRAQFVAEKDRITKTLPGALYSHKAPLASTEETPPFTDRIPEDAQKYIHRAFTGIEELYNRHQTAAPRFVGEVIEDPATLLSVAASDPDFALVRSHRRFRKYLRDAKDGLAEYKRIRDNCEPRVKERVEELQDF